MSPVASKQTTETDIPAPKNGDHVKKTITLGKEMTKKGVESTVRSVTKHRTRSTGS